MDTAYTYNIVVKVSVIRVTLFRLSYNTGIRLFLAIAVVGSHRADTSPLRSTITQCKFSDIML